MSETTRQLDNLKYINNPTRRFLLCTARNYETATQLLLKANDLFTFNLMALNTVGDYMFNEVLLPFVIVSVTICLFGVFGIVACCAFTTRAASRISRDITANMAQKIEDNIKRDIDSGRFFY